MRIWKRTVFRYFASVASVSAIPLAFWPIYDKVEDTTAASALLVVVLLVATKWGTGPAITASVLATVYLNSSLSHPLSSFSCLVARTS
jgi:hypothetical protein